jgi:predicted DNA-binding protein
MATTKKRLNITLSPESEIMVAKLAARDQVPAATKVRELLELSLELVEDKVLTDLAEQRLTQKLKRKPLSHGEVWGS